MYLVLPKEEIQQLARTTQNVKWKRDRNGVNYINQYKIIKELGHGSYGKVKLCEDKQKYKWAIKILTKKSQTIGVQLVGKTIGRTYR